MKSCHSKDKVKYKLSPMILDYNSFMSKIPPTFSKGRRGEIFKLVMAHG